MITVEKNNKKTQIVDFAVPADHWIEIFQQTKIENHQDVKRELQNLWNVKISIVPLITGALGIIPESLKKHHHELNVEVTIS